jgi:monoamine oxidase
MLYQVGDDGKAFGTLTNAGGHGLAYCDVGGSWADELEQQSVKARVDYALSKLRDLLGSDIDRAFVKGDATSWGQNPLTRGSYASAEPGAYRMRRVLRDSVGDRIFFAGEACHPSLWASVAGAHLSGQSVAGNVAREI